MKILAPDDNVEISLKVLSLHMIVERFIFQEPILPHQTTE